MGGFGRPNQGSYGWGAFFKHDDQGEACKSGNWSPSGYRFDASRYNKIYGASTTVQPPAVKVYAWTREA